MLIANPVILIVDDELDILSLTAMTIQLSSDWRTITANSVNEGIDKATTEHPDIILSDIDMPYMNGIEMLRVLKENSSTKDIPVILFTGRCKEMTAQEYAHLGVKAIISKPFNSLTLTDQIAEAVK